MAQRRHGLGNGDDLGRAKNRRVELKKQGCGK